MIDDPTLDEFRALLDGHGTPVQYWPMPVRSRAQALLADPAYRAVWDEAIALDTILDCWSVSSPSPGLIERVVATAPRRRPRLLWPFLAAAAALSGVAVGSVAAAAISPHPDRAADVTSTAFGSLEGGTE